MGITTETITLTDAMDAVKFEAPKLLNGADMSAFLKAKRDEIDGMYRWMADNLAREMYGLNRTAFPTLLAGVDLNGTTVVTGVGQSEVPPTGISVAVATVATTVLALEWLRRRKQLVAAEDPDSVIREFREWFVAWMRRLAGMFGKEQST